MADNNYVEGQIPANSYALTNPYATSGTALTLKGIKRIDDNEYLASFQYVIAAGGATTTITPITGNTQGDLKHYRVEISDGVTVATAQLSLAARTTPFVVDTSGLVTTAAWSISFYGAVANGGVGDAYDRLSYKIDLALAAAVAGVTANTIPAQWVNVTALLKLTSTDDAAFDLFPAAGLVINNGDSIDLIDYLTGAVELNNAGSYVFSLELKKLGTQPVAATPTLPSNDVFASKTDAVAFPYAISKTSTPVLTALTIETATAGSYSELMTFALTNEGVVPSFSFTVNTEVAA